MKTKTVCLWLMFIGALLFGLWMPGWSNARSAAMPDTPGARMFTARGVVQEIRPAEHVLVVQHDEITDYMAAMVMPFHVKDPSQMAGLARGDEITFQLLVTETNSWLEHIVKIGKADLPAIKPTAIAPQSAKTENTHPDHPLLDYQFTNELGQAVSLNDFHGSALAITFFYTRCPVPDYCPRLSKNFQAAAQKLGARTDAPTNWHFLSISFDSAFDTPAVLKTYAASYQADPGHWSFLTGPPDRIGELAHQSGLTFETTNGIFDHDFRTLIVDATGRLQTVFPTGGNISDAIVEEIIKAAAASPKPEPPRRP